MCALSNVPMTHIQGQGKVPTNVSIDRIDPTKGYERDNVQLVCYWVNIMKGALFEEEFFWWLEQILRNRSPTS